MNRLALDSGLTGIDAGLILALAGAGVWQFFWPLISLLGVLVVAATVFAGIDVGRLAMEAGASTFGAIASGVGMGLVVLVTGGLLALIVLLIRLFGVFTGIRTLEQANQPDNRVPDREVLAKVIEQEDWAAQNHFAGISIMQEGELRRFTLRVAFWVVGQLVARRFAPGFLGELGTIHFARWILLPKTNKLLFFSNFGGSWESYLEDFITQGVERSDRHLEQHDRLSEDGEPVHGGRKRRRALQTLGAPPAAADAVLVFGLSAVHAPRASA